MFLARRQPNPAAAVFNNGVLTVTVDKPRQLRSKAKKPEINSL